MTGAGDGTGAGAARDGSVPRAPLQGPVGRDAHRWVTFRGRRTLVAAARTLTSALRLLETLPPLLDGDDRITVVHAHDPTSAFSDGVPELLRSAGCRVIPWARLPEARPDLIVSASENLDLPDGDRPGCPVLVLPHGIGFQKRVPDARGPGDRLSGVVPAQWLRSGRAWLAVSHPDQEKQLAEAVPETLGRTVLVGDPVFDDLTASLPQAAAYRRSLGVPAGGRLVVVSSTWGPGSLLGRDPHLPRHLLAELPYDTHRVAAIVHPNVWGAHGSWHLQVLQSAARDAGLLLVPPAHAWRTALAAADVVVGDHGSVTLYGAALGKPTLLAAFGADSVPGTAAAHLGATAPRLAPPGHRRAQLTGDLARPSAAQAAALAARAFADPGRAAARLRTALYDLLDLPEPSRRPPHPSVLAPAVVPAARVTSWIVTGTVGGAASGAPVVTVRRYPAAAAEGAEEVQDAVREEPGTSVHLACDVDERDPQLTESASVLLRGTPAESEVAAVGWLAGTLRRFPGSRLAAVPLGPRSFLAGLRDGRTVAADVTGPPPGTGLPAAVVYACLRAGVPLDGAFVTLRVEGLGEADVALRTRHRGAPDG